MTAAPFTTEDFAHRMERAAGQARDAGLGGVLVTPGPDLIYFSGYSPIAITGRITMLAINASRDPAMIVPILGFEAVRPGVACQEVDRAARKLITAGYGEYFIHRTGHGIGLTTHEPPYMAEGDTLPMQPGMCFSIEPGIYLPGRFGVRIEDIATVTDTGGQRLNNTSHAMRSIS